MTDNRQSEYFGHKKFGGGPTGPYAKGLLRENVWPDGMKDMVIRDNLGPFA